MFCFSDVNLKKVILLFTLNFNNLVTMPRGRPAAPTFIVPVAELMDVATIHEERCCMWELRHELDNQMMILVWLARRGLIRNSNDCNQCKTCFLDHFLKLFYGAKI